MFGRYSLLFLGLLVLISTLVLAETNPSDPDVEPELPGNLIDIDTELGKEKDDDLSEESGSGKDDTDDEDDEDLDKSSGSGSGGNSIEEKDGKSSTSKPLTPCENLHEASKHLLGNYVPRCTETGAYSSRQCRGYPRTGRCWCADTKGVEIPGTVRDPPQTPDCETGLNLSQCVFELVQNKRNQLLGVFLPKCKSTGEYDEMQCKGSICYCVDRMGKKIMNTEMQIHKKSKELCLPSTPEAEPEIILPDETETKNNPVYTIDSKLDNEVLPEGDDDDSEERSPNETGEDEDAHSDPMKEETKMATAHIMTQPGLLAAIIGGAVVALLCAILLVMFIVYRMRKKDAGSYALDEPRKQSAYAKINQSEKEYYA